MDPITEALQRLDTMDGEVTDWEATFLNSLLQRQSYSAKQKAVLSRMVDKYLADDQLAAELRGQQRLWAEP